MSDIFDYLKELTKFELIYKDENDVPQSVRSYIKSISDGCILIDPPTKAGTVQNIKDGTNIKMVIYAEGGMFSGESTILQKELSNSISGVWISYPRNSQYCQRREYVRVPIHKEIKVTLFKDRDMINKYEFTAVTRDISGSGISFINDEQLTGYYNIECLIPIKDEYNSLVKVSCEHVYSKPTTINGQKKYIHAFAYLDMLEKYSEKIIQECFQYQLEERRYKLLNSD